METLYWQDIVFGAFLMIAVPFMVRHYLSGTRIPRRVYAWVVIIGIVFISLGYGLNDFLLNTLKVSRADDSYHYQMGSEIAREINYLNWEFIIEYAGLGNKSFHILLGIFFFLTGAGKPGAEAFNCFMAFWGSLMLLRFFLADLSRTVKVPPWILPLVFFPGLFFWASILYKEALMYWSICIFFTSTVPTSSKARFKITAGTVTGFVVGMLLRPYSMVVWALSVGMSILILSGRFLYALIAVGIMIAAVVLAANQLQVEKLSEAAEFADTCAAGTSSQVGEGAESAIEYGGGPLFYVSGAISLFFRPFIWNVRAIRVVLSSIEIWSISLMIVFSWIFMDSKGWGLLLWRPDVLVSIMVCLCYCVLFTYVANEGQIVRLRLSAMPSLLTLAWLPLAHKLNKRSDFRRSQYPTQFVPS